MADDGDDDWTALHWTAWAAAAGLTFTASLIASYFVIFGDATGCNNAPTPHNRNAGLEHLGIIGIVISLGWLAAGFGGRHRLRVAAGAALGISPLLYTALTHMHVADWTGGFCF